MERRIWRSPPSSHRLATNSIAGTTPRRAACVVSSRVNIILLYRHEDPQLRDEAVELLFDVAANALNGQCLAGLTLPQLTNFTSWRWEKPAAPERQITAIFSYHYIVEGWNSYDTSE